MKGRENLRGFEAQRIPEPPVTREHASVVEITDMNVNNQYFIRCDKEFFLLTFHVSNQYQVKYLV